MTEFFGEFFTQALAFIVTLGILVAFHEYGHFWVARKLGVKVLRYSIGFGRPLWLRRSKLDGTEYAVAAIPLGGYVRMLDEAEGEVDPRERHRAFNRQPVWKRFAIVAAGPIANFLLAIAVFALMYMIGVNSIVPLLSAPTDHSIAAAAGFSDRDRIVAIQGREVETLKSTILELVDAGSEGSNIDVEVIDDSGRSVTRVLDIAAAGDITEGGKILENLGLVPWFPDLPAVIDSVVLGRAGERAGLQGGDEILAIDSVAVQHWVHWAEQIAANPGRTLNLSVLRDGKTLEIMVVPDTIDTDDGPVGQVGVYPHVPADYAPENRADIQLGPIAALQQGVAETWHMSGFILRMLGRMVIGKVSWENISGPFTIARVAGQSAKIGLIAFLSFMAMLSISLGVLNLLPVPVLDGGHLLFYLIEIVKGSPLSESAQQWGQQFGLGVIMLLMGLALYNDLSWYLG